jgi:hypothetical protein
MACRGQYPAAALCAPQPWLPIDGVRADVLIVAAMTIDQCRSIGDLITSHREEGRCVSTAAL